MEELTIYKAPGDSLDYALEWAYHDDDPLTSAEYSSVSPEGGSLTMTEGSVANGYSTFCLEGGEYGDTYTFYAKLKGTVFICGNKPRAIERKITVKIVSIP